MKELARHRENIHYPKAAKLPLYPHNMVHILLTNDDGPPSVEASPYVASLVYHLKHDPTIVVPHTQRSWIGKAHFAGKTLTTSYVYHDRTTASTYRGPFTHPQQDLLDEGLKEWKLVDGTPASCTDIGINHLNDGNEVDLVISGPNFGRNTSAVYITSSGTVGAAMEAANLGKKAIALSYGFETRQTEQHIVDEASRIAVKIIEYLWENWDDAVDLYAVNIPLFDGLKLGETKIHYAPILQNQWKTLFHRVDQCAAQDEKEHEEDIVDSSAEQHVQFQWRPDFHTVHGTVQQSKARGEHNDAVVLDNHGISVTPLKSVFKDVPINGEIQLVDFGALAKETSSLSINKGDIYLSINPEAYIYPALKQSLATHLPKLTIQNARPSLETIIKGHKVFQFGDYEDLQFDQIHSTNYLINSYVYRKALIRKHHLSHTIHSYVVKSPDSILHTAWPETFPLEVDYAEFLDDSLYESYELRQELERGEEQGNETDAKWWVLKPGMSDKGQGIRVFRTIEQLQAIFDSFEEDETDYEDEDEDSNKIVTSQLRHFIVQEYITNPLILPSYHGKKFHIRVYVLANGAIEVSVFNRMLALFSSNPYLAPSGDGDIEMTGHLTNTCLQGETPLVVEFAALEGLTEEEKDHIRLQIYDITSETFKAGVSIDKMNFQPIGNAFELYGLDFLVNEDMGVRILEVNAFPDFKQTGDKLKGLIYELFDAVVEEAVVPFFGEENLNDDRNRHDDEDVEKAVAIGKLIKVLSERTDGW